MSAEQHGNQPRYIRLHERDNVAIVVNESGVTSGTYFDEHLTAIEHIPQSHKVALTPIAQDQEIRRYGEVIGYALADIAQGAWVHEGLMNVPAAPALDNLPIATAIPAPKPSGANPTIRTGNR